MNEKLTERAIRLNKILKEKGAPFQVEHVRKFKNNMSLNGYILKSDLFDASLVVYYDENWWSKSDIDVVLYLISVFSEHSCKIDISPLMSADYIRSNIRPKLLSASNSSGLQEQDIAFIPFIDMVVVFYLPIEFEVNGAMKQGSIQVTYSMLDNFNISEDDAYSCAVHNIENHIEIFSMSSIFQLPIIKSNCEIFVIKTSFEEYGASSILSEKAIQQISDMIDGNIALIPSSIHEFLAIPYRSEKDFEVLREMVSSVNQTSVLPQDVLTDNVYVLKDGKVKNVF